MNDWLNDWMTDWMIELNDWMNEVWQMSHVSHFFKGHISHLFISHKNEAYWMNDMNEWTAWMNEQLEWMNSMNEWTAWMNEQLKWMKSMNEWIWWMKWKQGLRPWQSLKSLKFSLQWSMATIYQGLWQLPWLIECSSRHLSTPHI